MKLAWRTMWLMGGLCLCSLTVVADVQDRGYFSKANNRQIKIKVYMPPGYETGGKRYPVVYNLHGGGGHAVRAGVITPPIGASHARLPPA